MNADILVVDDTPDNLRLLLGILGEQGYNVRPASDGAYAISTAQANPPDLILLDIKMPGMNGYEVCERLKADERTSDIPVIFISALNDTFDKVKGFAIGAVDYISKPFQAEEVLARVKTHVSVWRLQHELRERNAQLQQELAWREQAEGELRVLNQQLQETNASKDTFFSIIAHDLRNPFNALLTLTEFLVQEGHALSKEQIIRKLDGLYHSAERVYALVENLLEWSRLERGLIDCVPNQLRLWDLVEKNVRLFRNIAEQKQIALSNLLPSDTMAYADYKMIDMVIRNLLSNALKFTSSGGAIEASLVRRDEHVVELSVKDTGVGMDQKILDTLFRIDRRATKPGTDGEKGSGLGLILCKEVVEKNRGSITVESEIGKGSKFIIALPCR
jgi:signal transduction histidine kinase